MEAARKSSPWLFVFLSVIVLIGFGSTPWVTEALGDSKKRGRMSSYKWKKLMNRWARELNVKCDYCHVKKGEEFDYKASTHHKTVAAYCDDNFVDALKAGKKGNKKVSCITCHKGKAEFLPKKSAKKPKKS